MSWLALLAAVGLAFGCGVAVGRHQAAARPPRLAFYGRMQTGADLRRRLFGGPS